MKTTTVTVTRRTRNLGYGSTSQPVRGSHGTLVIDSVDAPEVTGTARQILKVHADEVRRNSGHDWAAQLFVGGRRVVGLHRIEFADLQLLTTRDGDRYLADSVTLTVEAE